MKRGEALKTLVRGLKNDIPFFMSIDDDMNMISADMAIAIWEKDAHEALLRERCEDCPLNNLEI